MASILQDGLIFEIVEMERSGYECEGKREFRDDAVFSAYSLILILPFVLKEVLTIINSIMQRKGMFDPQ